MGTGKRLIPLTAGELMSLHGLTVEQGLRQGYCIEGREKEFREARKAAADQERRALAAPWYTYQTELPPSCLRQSTSLDEGGNNTKIQTNTETGKEAYTMETSTKITLLICLMSSEAFKEMPQTEKALMLTELLYGEKLPAAKHPGGRPKKNDPANAGENKDGAEG